MHTQVQSTRAYRIGDDQIIRVGVVYSNVLSGFSTWNNNKETLATDAELIRLITTKSSKADILHRCLEIEPEGRFAAVHASDGLQVTWIPQGQRFQIVYDIADRCERIVQYKEEDWICG